MKPHIQILNEYFTKELPQLKKSYKWKIPNIQGFSECGKDNYDSNVNLKNFLNDKWSNSNDDKDKLNLATVIVKDWGGVKNNKQETLIGYIKELDKHNPDTPLKGVASYSKIFSITDLEKFAIYDARVAACLNAIQFNSGIRDGVAFNYIPGRNGVTGDATKRSGFVYQENFKIKNLTTNSGWQKLPKNETYSLYLETLNKCLESFKDYQLYDLEMTLFSNAENECKKALAKVKNA
jgi:hypothetical protein